MAYEELIELLETNKLDLCRQVAATPAKGDPILLEKVTNDLVSTIDALNRYLSDGNFAAFKEFLTSFLLAREAENVPIEETEVGIKVFYNTVIALINQSWVGEEKAKLREAATRRIALVQSNIAVAALTTNIKKSAKSGEQFPQQS